MERHLEQSVLSRLPDGYQSILKQSVASEEDDMGIRLSFLVINFFYFHSLFVYVVDYFMGQGSNFLLFLF